MKKYFSLEHSLETVAALISVAGMLGVLQTFIIGKHFVIPTMLLALTILFGNLARFGFAGNAFARHILFWVGFLIACHTFFALFWARTPRELFGDAFVPLYGGTFLLCAYLSWQYAQKNQLFA